jgi:predicted pyridoxine 5'-phosphate oxidase superfamily flavin-nucleotide-binding protein
MYTDGPRELQDRFDSRRLADRLQERFADGGLLSHKTFIEAQRLFFLATADAEGRPQCSYKGGDPGFVRVLSDTELCFPSYDGNGMFLSAGNLLENPHVGLLFIDFSSPRRLRVSGTAAIDETLAGEFPGALFAVRVTATDVFPNCARYVHRMELVDRSPYVPDAEGEAPEPEWKRSEWARDVLPG